MRQVALPEPVYAKAARAAEAEGLSVDDFVLGLVQDRLEENAPLILTLEQIAIVRRGQEDVKAGRFFTSEDVRADLAELQAGWAEAHAQ